MRQLYKKEYYMQVEVQLYGHLELKQIKENTQKG